jgi:hypothetical protein
VKYITPLPKRTQVFSFSADEKWLTITELHLVFNHTYRGMFLMSRTYWLKITTFAKRFYGLCHHVTVFVWTEKVQAQLGF